MGYDKELYHRKSELLTSTLKYVVRDHLGQIDRMLASFSNVLGHARVQLTLALLVTIKDVEIIGSS